MILIVVWDGLRPDMITPENTPYLHATAQRGVFSRASHAAFPTATRINAASLSTGCYPGQHGIVDNELYIPEIDPARATSCADWEALQRLADQEQHEARPQPGRVPPQRLYDSRVFHSAPPPAHALGLGNPMAGGAAVCPGLPWA